jgi:eukaryotic-like serine/threonine-protein kinase
MSTPPEEDEPQSVAPTLARESDPSAPTMAALGGDERPTMLPMRGVRFADRYFMEDVLGRGGMGEVRLCSDERLGRDVALKTMHTTSSRSRFLREAKLQGRLEHPSVVPVYDVGEVVGTPFFTMRRVVGITLADVIAGLQAHDAEFVSHFSRRKLLTDFVQVCQAVAYAHDHGVVHRDLKPANIMLGDYGEVYVLDWGIAKTRGAASEVAEPRSMVPTESPNTADGSVLGTLGYMPPEQLAGAADKVDSRADIYALGAILFELLTLRPLHPGTTTHEKIQSTLDGVDARASVRAPELDVAPELEAVCVRATAREPADRHDDVRALIADVERFLDGDRDLARRRELARDHAALAETQLRRTDDELAARAEAVREAGRALVFDPDNADALRILGRLLVVPPTRTPLEVERMIAEAEEREAAQQAKVGAVVGVAWLVFLAFPLWMGLRDAAIYVGLVVSLFAVVALSVVRAVKRDQGTALVVVIAAVQAVVMGFATRMFGPFVIVPGIVAATTAMFAFNELRHLRVLVAFGIASILVPWALEHIGVLAPSYSYGDDALVVHANFVSFPQLPTEVTLVFANVGTVLMAALALSRARRGLHDARKRLAVQKWQLEQIVPSAAAESQLAAMIEH